MDLVIALAGDVPVAMLSSFVSNSGLLGSAAARYILVHFLLQLALLASLALPWHLSRSRSRAAGIEPADDAAMHDAAHSLTELTECVSVSSRSES